MSVRILVVCTGNVCRSPLAALRLSAALAASGVAAELVTAGTAPSPGEPMTPEAAAIARGWGLDPSAHRSRALGPALVEAADLVLTADRGHRAAVVGLAPRRVRRVFTLRECARLVAALDAEAAPGPAAPVADRVEASRARGAESLLEALAATRGTIPPPGRPEDDDVPDPYGRGAAAYDEAARLIAAAVDPIAAALVAAVRPASHGPRVWDDPFGAPELGMTTR